MPRNFASQLPVFKMRERLHNPRLLRVLSVERDETSEGAEDFFDTELLSVSRASPVFTENTS